MVSIQTLFFVVVIVYAIDIQGHSWDSDSQPGTDHLARWNRYKALPYKTESSALDAVCGVLSPVLCSTIAGRPSDAETDGCDIYCCRQGFLTGHCNPYAVINNNARRDADRTSLIPQMFLKRTDCTCSNDVRDVTCGFDVTLAGIRCPFDWSACRRKCCREGKSGGRCAGFLRLKCKCD